MSDDYHPSFKGKDALPKSSMLRRNVPLAQQVVREILNGIESGELTRDGGLLPSEAEMSQHFGVSRATLREALAHLENRGLIVRRQGVGTFVNQPALRLDAGLESLESIQRIASRMGLQTSCEEIQIVERPATAQEAAALLISNGTPVLSISRVICTNEERVAYLVDIVPVSCLSQDQLGDTFNGSVLDVLLQLEYLNLSYSRTNIMIETAGQNIASRLGISRSSALMKLEAQLFTREGAVVDYSLSYFVPGFFHFHVNRRIGSLKNGD